MTSREIPQNPTRPFDARSFSDEQIKSLTPEQFLWADCTEAQTLMWSKSVENAPWVTQIQPPSEGNPDYIPAADQIEQIRSLFEWVDTMATFVRRPQGMAWIEIELMLASLHKLMDWATSDPPINKRYRYRVDAPLDPDDSEVPDHLPEDWAEP